MSSYLTFLKDTMPYIAVCFFSLIIYLTFFWEGDD